MKAEARRLGSVSCDLSCYSLEEILAEKLRAVCGQRRFAIARDIYDVWRLMAHGVDAAPVLQTLPRKSAAKSVSLGGCLERFEARHEDYRLNWERTLARLVPGESSFDEAWTATRELVAKVSPT